MLKRILPLRVQLIFLLVTFIALGSCYYDNEETLYGGGVDCSQVVAKFGTDVSPIIQSKCAYSGCHDAGAAGGVSLTNYNQVFQNAARIRSSVVVSKTMPKSGSITPVEIAKIKCWLDAGAPNN
ncbi:MAG: hypothetical protein JNM68_16690 [Dinghuibacter sp.]|nr:hypothetical protein [Dinghuibacter sp.]